MEQSCDEASALSTWRLPRDLCLPIHPHTAWGYAEPELGSLRQVEAVDENWTGRTVTLRK